MEETELQNLLKDRVYQHLHPLFEKYNRDFSDLGSILKWKPMVLLIGNYSSGKSTLVNELAGVDIQRTGQAPTDDAFTIITSDSEGGQGQEIPGSTLVNDETLPFAQLKDHGEQFISHFRMKKVVNPDLANMAIIDSPGMLDSVTEKDRGYDYMAVIGQLAKLADLVVLMFDPLKAGTIKETYTAIRDTLPESAGEDRIVFAMSRIDECDSMTDLVRSYGTLCWNLSQMTGRKDIPHIHLTYAPDSNKSAMDLSPWAGERDELKNKILNAPKFRVYHILQSIDRQVNELDLTSQAMETFSHKARAIGLSTFKFGLITAVLAFFFTGLITKLFWGSPEQSFLEALLAGNVVASHFTFPIAGVTITTLVSWVWLSRWSFPRLLRQYRKQPENLVRLQNQYEQNLWSKVAHNVKRLLNESHLSAIFASHGRNRKKIHHFLENDLKEFYEKIR
jgi:energy-coupling factor transporter ATP-binding protein EcfA2